MECLMLMPTTLLKFHTLSKTIICINYKLVPHDVQYWRAAGGISIYITGVQQELQVGKRCGKFR